MPDQVRQVYDERQKDDVINWMRSRQTGGEAQPTAAPAPTAPEAPAPLPAPASGTAQASLPPWPSGGKADFSAMKIGGQVTLGHWRDAVSRTVQGLSQFTMPNTGSFLENQKERLRGLGNILSGIVETINAPAIGGAAMLMKPVLDQRPWMKDVVVAKGQTAQAVRDVLGGAIPVMTPEGMYVIRPGEALKGEAKGMELVGGGMIGKGDQYGKDVPDLTLAEALGMATTISLAVSSMGAATGGKAKAGGKAGEPTAAPEAAPSPATGAAAPISGGAEIAGGLEGKPSVGGRPFTAQEIPPVSAPELSGLERAALDESRAVPPEGTVGPRAFGVNWERLGTDDAIKRITLEVNKQITESTAANLAARGEQVTSEGAGGVTQTHAMTQAQAARNPFSLTDVVDGKFLRPGDTVDMLPARLTALKSFRDQMDTYLWNQVGLANAGDTAAKADLPAVAALSRLTAERTKEFTSAVARAQEAGKIESDPLLAPVPHDRLDATLRNLTADMDGETIGNVLGDLRKNQGVDRARTWLDNVTQAAKTGKSMAWEYLWTSKLSSPTTWAKKALSDLGTMFYSIPQRALMRANHELFWADDPMGTQAGEVGALYEGYKSATINTIAALKKGESLSELPGVTSFDRDWAISANNMGLPGMAELRAASTPGEIASAAPGAAVDAVGAALHFGPNVLKTTTQLAQAIDFGAEASAQSVRLASVELRRFEGTPTYDQRFADRVQYIREHVAEFPQVQDAAAQAAQRMTYTQPLGPAAESFKDWMDKTPGLRINQLYYNIPVNLAKRASHLFPPTWVASRIWGEMGRQWDMGGAAREAALADLQTGIAISAGVGFLVAESRMTGGGPTDPGLRERWLATGRRPYSLYPQGQTAGAPVLEGYHLIAPLGVTLGAMADFGEIVAQIPQESTHFDRALQIGTAIPLGLAKTIKNEPMFMGWSEFLGAMTAPDKGATHWTEGFMRGLVPTGWQRLEHAYIDNTMKEIRGPLDALRAAVWSPGMVDRKDVITGEPRLYPPGIGPDMVSPFTYSEIKPDTVAEELSKQQIRVPRFPWVVQGTREPAAYIQMTEPTQSEGVPLTPQQRDRWIDITTKEISAGGKNLHDALEARIESSKYQTLPVWPDNASRQTEMSIILNAYRADGLKQLRKEDPNLDVLMRLREEERLRKQLPVTNPGSLGTPGPLFQGVR